MPTSKGTEAIVLYTMFLVSSSINVSICYSTWLDTLWTGFVIYSQQSLTRVPRTHDGERGISSINAVGKTEHPHAKE